MKTVQVFIGIYSHRHGVDVSADTTMRAALKRQANVARGWWEERADQSAPDDYSDLSDEEVIEAYFDGNEIEFYDIEQTTLDIDT
jgi:hypothetical protein